MAEIIISDSMGGNWGFYYRFKIISCIKELWIDDRYLKGIDLEDQLTWGYRGLFLLIDFQWH